MGVQLFEDRYGVLARSFAPAAVSANTTAEQTFSVPGLRVGDFVAVSKPTQQAGILVGTARVSAADTIAIQFANNTAGSITPTTETYAVFYFRPELITSAPRT